MLSRSHLLRTLLAVLLLLSAGSALGAFIADDANGSLLNARFVHAASAAGRTQLAMARAAMRNARDPDVRELARAIAEDRAREDVDLTRIADRLGMRFATPGGVARRRVQYLRGLHGPAFDAAYLQAVIATQAQSLKLYRRTETATHAEDIRAYAGAETKTVLAHLRHAHVLQARLRQRG